MNEKAIFEIGDLLHIRYEADFLGLKHKLMTPKEITECFEYKSFKKTKPELCKLAEEVEK